MTSTDPLIPCIGSVLWDVIGRHRHPMRLGDDRPGAIERLPGGVALNVAMTLVRFGMRPTVLTVIGTDREGAELVAECGRRGIDTGLALRRADLPTDRYMAVEAANGLIAAIADAQSLEAAGAEILAPLGDGRLGSAEAPFAGPVALDGNLTEDLLADIAASPLLRAADLRVVPASPGKAVRLRPLLAAPNATLYLNLEEAGLLGGAEYRSSAEAASALVARGCARVIVTAGANPTTDADGDLVLTAHPPQIEARRFTGAGDTFMAAHIAAEARGHARNYALEAALQAAATHVSAPVAEYRG
jgi:sugar/nucleoside kinase (ribokinase family)